MTDAAPALEEAAFFSRLSSLNVPKKFAVAISGGRDSMALARLCAAYAQKHGAEALALTVDHGLRAGAADEAAQAKRWCEAAGLTHRTLHWEGEKPSSGVQGAARAARYALLIEAAQAHGCEALLTAHSEDDQAETVFMRLARGAGLRGLAAMREESLIAAGPGEPLRLLRPLLFFSRDSVTAYLREIAQNYFDDPSNDDDRFERVRVRALLAALGEQGLITTPSMAASARKLAAAEDAAMAQEDALFDHLGGCFYGWGGASLDRWEDAPGADGLARRLIYAVGGGAYMPDGAAARDAVELAASSGAATPQKATPKATVGGAMIMRWRGRLWFLREAAALTGRAGVSPVAPQGLAAPLLWDRRFVIAPSGAAAGLQIAPLGHDAPAFLGQHAGLFRGPPEALASLPGLMRDGVLIGAPALPFMDTEIVTCRPPTCLSLTMERFRGRIVRFS
ncbi:tRNA lysidine(34) synthetase TilS [Marinicaulis aureus]|uniref:tRNA(Ile)-lysidine synthase n=1 Tax=Hyphococcus aureus TaxID=2666033 RepID=A0ABW1KUS3_9PROT